MATSTTGQQFPAQKQDRQPGRKHVMDPVPQATSPAYKPANKLHGKVALVTGDDSGQCVTALLWRNRGLHLSKNADAKDPIALPADLGFKENCKMVMEEVVNAYGRIDVLVNNATEQHKSNSIEEIDEQRLERVFRTNVLSYLYALNHMTEGSSIINTASVVAYRDSPKLLDYTATKGAIVSFTRGLALHLVNRGIRVNGVAPGSIWTPLIPSLFNEEEVAKFGSRVPMKRAGQLFEVGPSYVFLACNDSSYIAGQVLHPNGGEIVNG
ncbi:NAD(P)-binding Rossmann-fold superfamily protein [Actinidia rufa]|uniref:NAD(P)-binding Rossmann-fold superfamily protein n=1 Tax=Actinidia rufa TaxID=165716 RepID=A0A7J0EZU3_9ERIC|nr:NAD(P)-binding Rossmann-fold superfamily protein [Actinidia rufa]